MIRISKSWWAGLVKPLRRLQVTGRWRAHQMMRRRAETLPTAVGREQPGGGTYLSGIRFLVAGEAAQRMANAIDQGRLHAAEKVWSSLGVLEHQHPHLIEQGVRLAILRGRTGAALALLEREGVEHPRLRLLLQAVRIIGGQKAAAHLDLCEWTRQPNCPDEAVALLAWLEREAGDAPAAAERLARIDPWRTRTAVRQLQLLSALEVDDQRRLLQTLGAAGRLTRPDDWFALFLRSLNLTRRLVACEPPREMVDALAMRLLGHPELIPALVRTQRLSMNLVDMQLLRRALQRLVRDAAEPAPLCNALAELALLSGEPDTAADWARRGLRSTPADAHLALLLDRAERAAHPEVVHETGPTAANGLIALRQAAHRHPEYADLQRAVVLRYRDAGHRQQAEAAFAAWCASHEDHPLTARMREDLAA